MDIHLRNFESMPICKVKAISNRFGMILPFPIQFFVLPVAFYDARAISGVGILASMFSKKMPYPVVGSLMRTCVTAPTSLPF